MRFIALSVEVRDSLYGDQAGMLQRREFLQFRVTREMQRSP